jgi:hypothetical protein
MSATAKKTIYDRVVEVTYEYLGPAAERFVAREVEAHLGKKPQDLTKADIAKLHDWSRLAIALLTEDSKMVDEFSASLLAIAGPSRKSGTR